MKAWGIAAAIISGVSLLLAVVLFVFYDSLPSYWQGFAIESGGVVLEVILLLVAFGGYEQWRRRSDDISRHKERIEDVKRINDPHAHGILASAIRALARYNITDIDLRGAQLTGFSFQTADIQSIAGATICDGMHLIKPSRNFAHLKDVDFTYVNCSGTVFGSGDLSLAAYDDCTFFATNLKDASFEGVTLRSSKDRVITSESDWYEEIDREDDGSPIMAQKYSPAFDGANLEGCNFKGARLENVDFRGAKNVGKANFEGAYGLATCFFDTSDDPRLGPI